MLALALSSAPQDVANDNSDASHGQGSGAIAVSSNPESTSQSTSVLAADAASQSVSQSDSVPARQELKDGIKQVSGICCSLKFSIPFDACSSLHQGFAKVNLCFGNQAAPLGTLQFEADARDEQDRGPSHAEEASSIMLESFRMLDEHGEFCDEPIDLAMLPEFVGSNSLIDHTLIDNAVKKILSQELLVS